MIVDDDVDNAFYSILQYSPKVGVSRFLLPGVPCTSTTCFARRDLLAVNFTRGVLSHQQRVLAGCLLLDLLGRIYAPHGEGRVDGEARMLVPARVGGGRCTVWLTLWP